MANHYIKPLYADGGADITLVNSIRTKANIENLTRKDPLRKARSMAIARSHAMQPEAAVAADSAQPMSLKGSKTC